MDVHKQQYFDESDERLTMGIDGEPYAMKEICSQLAKIFNGDVGFMRYDAGWMDFSDTMNEDWIKGVPDYALNVCGWGGFYVELRLKRRGIFRKTMYGGLTKSGSRIPNYGCESFYLNIFPVHTYMMDFCQKLGINPENYLIMFFLLDEDEIYSVSLGEIDRLLREGFKGNAIALYGDGYGVPTYLFPIGATHHVGSDSIDYFKDKFAGRIIYPIDVLRQSNCFAYESPTVIQVNSVNVAAGQMNISMAQQAVPNMVPVQTAPVQALPPIVNNDDAEQLFIGDKPTGVYHYPDCSLVSKIPGRFLEFHTRRNAIYAGFRPCEQCVSNVDRI